MGIRVLTDRKRGGSTYAPFDAPQRATLKASYPTEYESPQLRTLAYRPGNYRPSVDESYHCNGGAQRDSRHSGGNT